MYKIRKVLCAVIVTVMLFCVLPARGVPGEQETVKDTFKGTEKMEYHLGSSFESEGPTPCSRAGPDVWSKNITFYDTNVQWSGFSVGTVGEITRIDFGIGNLGDQDATNVNLEVRINNRFEGGWMDTFSTTIPLIEAGNNTTVAWTDWVPSYTTRFTVYVNVTTSGDVNTSNDDWTYGLDSQWWINLFLDEGDDDTNWTGDIGPTEWHVTDSIMGDPDPGTHSSPSAWYAGTETVLADAYTGGMDVSLISPSIDLRRIIPDFIVYLNFKYYGAVNLFPGEGIGLFISTDNGVTWTDTRTFISSIFDEDALYAWHYRTDNYVDLDRDGNRDAGEYDVGIDISEYMGHQIKLKFRFTSMPASTNIGFYVDDIIVFGTEKNKELAITDINNLATTHVHENETATVTVTNLGRGNSATGTLNLELYRGLILVKDEQHSVSSIPEFGTQDFDFNFAVDTAGDYLLKAYLDVNPDDDGSPYNNYMERRIHVSTGSTGILLVDDDGGPINNGKLHYRGINVDVDDELSSAISTEHDVYHVLWNQDGPDISVLQNYHTVVWTTGFDGTGRSISGTLTPNDISVLEQYLDDGGSLWLASQEVMFDLQLDETGFQSSHLHVSDYADDAGTPSNITGVTGNPITHGMMFPAEILVPANDRADGITPGNNAAGIFYQDDTSQNPVNGPFNGIMYNGSYKLVVTSFEPAAVMDSADRTEMADAIIAWLYAGLDMWFLEDSEEIYAGDSVNFTAKIFNHGSKNLTVEDLGPVNIPNGWSAEVEPSVSSGNPFLQIEGFSELLVEMQVTSPKGISPFTNYSMDLELVVAETGEILSSTATAHVLKTGGINITASPAWQQASVGQNASYLVSIKNDGNVAETVFIGISGPTATWATLEKTALILDPSEKDDIKLTVEVPNKTEAGLYDINITANSTVEGMAYVESTNVSLEVRQYFGLEIADAKASNSGKILPDDPNITITVSLDNKGNGLDAVTIDLDGDFQEADQWQMGEVIANVPPFAKNFDIDIALSAWNASPGGEYNITISAMSQDNKTVVKGFVIVTFLRPDLYLKVDGIVFDETPIVGQAGAMTIKVYNSGEVESPDATVMIYSEGGQKIGEYSVGQAIKAKSFGEIFATWIPEFKGSQDLTFYIDERNEIVEMNEDNNTLVKMVTALQPNLNADSSRISLNVDGLDVERPDAGKMVTIIIEILNTDTDSYKADDVKVEILMDGEVLATKTIDIKANDNEYIEIDWKAVKGSHILTVKVDPDNKILESNEKDNEAEKAFNVNEPEPPGFELAFDSPILWAVIIVVIIILIGYAAARGIIPSPFRKSGVLVADHTIKCPECGKKIKEGKKYYKCACGRPMHIKCAKKVELCECLRRVRLD
jgi:uncharacterized membrane protein